MVDIDLDKLERLAKAANRHNPTAVYMLATATDPQTVLALVERVKRAEATIAKVLAYATTPVVAEYDEDGDPLLDAQYVDGANGARHDAVRILATYQNGADHDD